MTEHHLDRFAESLGEGGAYATKIFGRMARLTLVSQPTRILTAEHRTPMAEILPAGDRLYAGIVPLSGDLFGQAMMVFSEAHASEIARSMSAAMNVAVADAAAFEELVNIYANTALASITRDFRLSVYPAPPRLTKGGPDAIWRAFVDPVNQPEPQSTVAVIDLATADRKITGRFLLLLRSDSLQNVRWKTVANADKRVDVKMGDLCVAAAPGVLKVTSLGSCLAVILYDPASKLGAIAHVMLPVCTAADLGRARPGKYADTAVDALLKSFPGTPAGRLRVWLIGGASMFSVEGSSAMQIGKRNVEVTKQRLAAAGIASFAEETGGNSGRTVELDTNTGEVTIHGPQGVKRVIPHSGGKKPPATNPPATPLPPASKPPSAQPPQTRPPQTRPPQPPPTKG